MLGDPKTVFEPYPNPKNSQLGRDGFSHVGALGLGYCGSPFLSGGKESKLGLSWARLSHVWPLLIRSLVWIEH